VPPLERRGGVLGAEGSPRKIICALSAYTVSLQSQSSSIVDAISAAGIKGPPCVAVTGRSV
jgi:hypothetical protein